MALVHINFAENSTCTWQDEIQSAYWNQRQITVYTVMSYHQHKTVPWIIASENRDHDKRAVTAFLAIILNKLKNDMPNVKTVNIWTDGPSSQYKNKFICAVTKNCKICTI